MKKFLLAVVIAAIGIAAGVTTCVDANNTSGGNETYTVSFDPNGGSGGPDPVTATYGKAMPAIAGAPSNEENYFTGYFDDQTGGKRYYNADLSSAAKWDKKENAVLYAQWSPIPFTTVKFNANDGDGTMADQYIPENTGASLTANTFIRPGHKFTGWATTSGGTDVAYTDGANYTAGAGTNAVTLYAVWEAKTFEISFSANGGTGGPQSITATYGEAMPSITVAAPTRTGFIFAGYFDAQSNGKKYYNENLGSAASWDKDGETSYTLYAQWSSGVPSTVSIVRSSKAQAADLDYNDILALTREAIRLAGGLGGIVKSGDVVVLKPNLICTVWNWGTGTTTTMPQTVNGVTTDWRVVQAVAEIVREIIGPYNASTGKGKIMVMEGPGKSVATSLDSTHHFTNMKYTLTDLTHVNEIISLHTEGSWTAPGNAAGSTAYVTQITLPEYFYKGATGDAAYLRYYKNDGKYWVNKKMLEADALISIPVVKSHWNATVTGAIKNIGIGAAPPTIYGRGNGADAGRNDMVNHSSVVLHDWIADYFSCLPADFVVMDGLQGLQNGPLPGVSTPQALAQHQKNLRCMLASKDALAIDKVAANIINADYTTIPYMTQLTARGEVYARGEIGKSSPRKIPLRGNTKDIVVLGNVKVDDVRADYTIAAAAGNPGLALTPAKKTPPTVTISSAAFSGQNLTLSLALSSGENNAVVKIDVYIDGAYAKSFNANMASVSLDASGLAAGSRGIEVRAYTDYMFSATATTTAVKP